MNKLIPASILFWFLASCSNPVPVTSTETLPELSSSAPPATPDARNTLQPQETPAHEWRGIPIPPGALAGQEFSEDNAYSFKTNLTASEVQDFYLEAMTQLGWSQPFNTPFDADGGRMTFRKENSSLTITVSFADGVVVVLVLTLA